MERSRSATESFFNAVRTSETRACPPWTKRESENARFKSKFLALDGDAKALENQRLLLKDQKLQVEDEGKKIKAFTDK